MTSAERLYYYTKHLELEQKEIEDEIEVPSKWPNKGKIELKQLTASYHASQTPVLRDINLTISNHLYPFI